MCVHMYIYIFGNMSIQGQIITLLHIIKICMVRNKHTTNLLEICFAFGITPRFSLVVLKYSKKQILIQNTKNSPHVRNLF